MFSRLETVGETEDYSFRLPLTQTELGDTLGLSTVHVNRTLQELRKSGLITLRGTTLNVLNWDGLEEAGDFNPTYLHLQNREAA